MPGREEQRSSPDLEGLSDGEVLEEDVLLQHVSDLAADLLVERVPVDGHRSAHVQDPSRQRVQEGRLASACVGRWERSQF